MNQTDISARWQQLAYNEQQAILAELHRLVHLLEPDVTWQAWYQQYQHYCTPTTPANGVAALSAEAIANLKQQILTDLAPHIQTLVEQSLQHKLQQLLAVPPVGTSPIVDP